MISKGGKNIPASEAMQHVGGYFLGLDMTDRDYQASLKS
jgi:2-keto-4-pentenoate hydratase/2-oxohepta-3-ene-1,7-dioic acid hydratase in catechol pathway